MYDNQDEDQPSEGGLISRLSAAVMRKTTGVGREPKQKQGSNDNEGVNFYLSEEVRATRETVQQLDKAADRVQSYRDKSAELVREAHRALGRLEQAVACSPGPELISIACEIKVTSKRGLQLVERYGSYNTVMKVATVMARKYVNEKFDKVVQDLQALMPPKDEPEPQPREEIIRKNTGGRPLCSRSTSHPACSPSGPPQGTLIRTGHHDKVYCLTYVPFGALTSNYICVWWSVAQALEFYSENSQSTTAFQIENAKLCVTAIAIDQVGNVWTGHYKGVIRMRRKQLWDQVLEDKCFSSPIKVIVFDEQGHVWVGDEAGKVKVLQYDDVANKVTQVASLQRVAPKASRPGGGVGILDGAFGGFRFGGVLVSTPSADPQSPSSAASTSAGTTSGGGPDGPIKAICVRGNRAWVSGGKVDGWITMWDTLLFKELDTWDCSQFGPCNVMRTLSWVPNRPLTRQSMPYPSVIESKPSTESIPPAQQQQSDSGWRLLTAHENGQLLLWHPDADKLAPLLKIGDPGSAIRGLVIFEDVNLIVTGHVNGEMQAFFRPDVELAMYAGAGCSHPNSFGVLRPKRMTIKAHKSNLSCMAGYINTCVTASVLGTIRMWYLKDLMAEAERVNLITRDFANKHSAGSSSAITDALGTGPPSGLSQHGLGMRATRSRDDLQSLGYKPSSASSMEPRRRLSQSSYTSGGLGGDSNNTAAPSEMGRTNSRSVSGQSRPGTDVLSSLPPPISGFQCQQIEGSEVQLKKLIGTGAYGKVWLADWTGCQVAVKELIGFTANSASEARLWQEMMNEVHLLGALSHPNIMRFMAVCLAPPMIVMQYYPHGSLFDLLKKARSGNPRAIKELNWNKRLEMLKDVAAGMHYLHTRKPPVIHGDLRSPNLLLDLTIDRERPRFHVKIADFGLARMNREQHQNIAVSKTTNPRWSAPEVIKESKIGPAGDVYSFAVVMWEMLTWQQPYEEMMSVQVIFSTVSENTRPDVPPLHLLPGNPGVSIALYQQLMEKCWTQDAKERPSFKQILDFIQAMRELEFKTARQQQQAAAAAAMAPATPQPQRKQLEGEGSGGPEAGGRLAVQVSGSPPLAEVPGRVLSGGHSGERSPISDAGGPGSLEGITGLPALQAILSPRGRALANAMEPIREEGGRTSHPKTGGSTAQSDAVGGGMAGDLAAALLASGLMGSHQGDVAGQAPHSQAHLDEVESVTELAAKMARRSMLRQGTTSLASNISGDNLRGLICKSPGPGQGVDPGGPGLPGVPGAASLPAQPATRRMSDPGDMNSMDHSMIEYMMDYPGADTGDVPDMSGHMTLRSGDVSGLGGPSAAALLDPPPRRAGPRHPGSGVLPPGGGPSGLLLLPPRMGDQAGKRSPPPYAWADGSGHGGSVSPFAVLQQQSRPGKSAGGTSPFAAAAHLREDSAPSHQTRMIDAFSAVTPESPTANSPFAAASQQAQGAGAGVYQSPFAAAQHQQHQTPVPSPAPYTSPFSPFAAAQQQEARPYASPFSPFAAAQQHESKPHPSPFSPFAAVQQEAEPSPSPAPHPSPFSPFAAVQQQNEPSPSPAPHASPFSPFAAVQQEPAPAPHPSPYSPFAAVQQEEVETPSAAPYTSPFSPFAAAAAQQQETTTTAAPYSPFAAAQQQHGSQHGPVPAAHYTSPFAAAQQQTQTPVAAHNKPRSRRPTTDSLVPPQVAHLHVSTAPSSTLSEQAVASPTTGSNCSTPAAGTSSSTFAGATHSTHLDAPSAGQHAATATGSRNTRPNSANLPSSANLSPQSSAGTPLHTQLVAASHPHHHVTPPSHGHGSHTSTPTTSYSHLHPGAESATPSTAGSTRTWQPAGASSIPRPLAAGHVGSTSGKSYTSAAAAAVSTACGSQRPVHRRTCSGGSTLSGDVGELGPSPGGAPSASSGSSKAVNHQVPQRKRLTGSRTASREDLRVPNSHSAAHTAPHSPLRAGTSKTHTLHAHKASSPEILPSGVDLSVLMDGGDGERMSATSAPLHKLPGHTHIAGSRATSSGVGLGVSVAGRAVNKEVGSTSGGKAAPNSPMRSSNPATAQHSPARRSGSGNSRSYSNSQAGGVGSQVAGGSAAEGKQRAHHFADATSSSRNKERLHVTLKDAGGRVLDSSTPSPSGPTHHRISSASSARNTSQSRLGAGQNSRVRSAASATRTSTGGASPALNAHVSGTGSRSEVADESAGSGSTTPISICSTLATDRHASTQLSDASDDVAAAEHLAQLVQHCSSSSQAVALVQQRLHGLQRESSMQRQPSDPSSGHEQLASPTLQSPVSPPTVPAIMPIEQPHPLHPQGPCPNQLHAPMRPVAMSTTMLHAVSSGQEVEGYALDGQQHSGSALAPLTSGMHMHMPAAVLGPPGTLQALHTLQTPHTGDVLSEDTMTVMLPLARGADAMGLSGVGPYQHLEPQTLSAAVWHSVLTGVTQPPGQDGGMGASGLQPANSRGASARSTRE